MDVTSKAQARKGKMGKLDFIKIKNLLYIKSHRQWSEKATYRLGEAFADHVSGKGLIHRMDKESHLKHIPKTDRGLRVGKIIPHKSLCLTQTGVADVMGVKTQYPGEAHNTVHCIVLVACAVRCHYTASRDSRIPYITS